MTDWFLVAASLALVVACGVFVAAEFSFVTVDRAAVDQAAEAGDGRAKGLAAALSALSTQLSGAQLGITITNLAIGFLAEPAVAGIADGPLTRWGLPATWVSEASLAAGLVLASALTMLFGELVPKNLAIAHPLGVGRATQGFQRGFSTVMAVPIRTLNGSANAMVRLLGIEPQEELRSTRGAAELASLVRRSASEGTLDRGTADLAQRALLFGGRTASSIMTPRVRTASVRAGDSAAEVLALARDTGRSRFPVTEPDVDSVVGLVHIKHALAVTAPDRSRTAVRRIAVPAIRVPESLPVEELMARLREGLQMAVVIDEYGGTAGVVTLEDVVEELVGEIADEHDARPVVARGDFESGWSLSGLLRPDEIREVTGVGLPTSPDYDTLGGLVVHALGHVPEPEESVDLAVTWSHAGDGGDVPVSVDGLATLLVERMAGRRVDRVSMRVHGAAEGER